MATRNFRTLALCLALLLTALLPSNPPLTALDPETRIRAVEREIVQSLTEIGVLFSEDGAVIARFGGTCCYVDFDFAVYDRLWRQYRGNVIFTHNHPAGAWWYFSKDDVNAALLYRVKQMRVVGWRESRPHICVFNYPRIESYPRFEYRENWGRFFKLIGAQFGCAYLEGS